MNIYLIGKPAFDFNAFKAFTKDNATSWKRSDKSNPSQAIVEIAGRVCYMSFGKEKPFRSNSQFIRHLIRQGHESVLEHVSWTFILDGVTRAFTHQLVRHRIGFAYSQLSQQYHEETEATFVEPPHLTPEARIAWKHAVDTCKASYQVILSAYKKKPKSSKVTDSDADREIRRALYSAARSVLPNATTTKIVVTANARALRHFLAVRGAIQGDEEMRQVAAGLLRVLEIEAPDIFSDFRIETLPDGSPIVFQTPLKELPE